MKTIIFQKSFVIGPYLQEKIGFEIIVEDGEDPEKLLKDARELSNKMNIDGNPHLVIQEPTSVKEISMDLGEAIASCTDLKALESYRLLAARNTLHKEIYDEKYSELSK